MAIHGWISQKMKVVEKNEYKIKQKRRPFLNHYLCDPELTLRGSYSLISQMQLRGRSLILSLNTLSKCSSWATVKKFFQSPALPVQTQKQSQKCSSLC